MAERLKLTGIGKHFGAIRALDGVSLSIGSTDPLDYEYLKKVGELARRSNAAWLGERLAEVGVDVLRSETVRDDVDAIVTAIDRATDDGAALIVVTGGLGQQIISRHG